MVSAATDDATSPETAYNDLRRLTPSLAAELDHLRASLREHNLWLQRYGHNSSNSSGGTGGQGSSSHNQNDDDAALASVPAGLPTLTTRPTADRTPASNVDALPPPPTFSPTSPTTSGPPADLPPPHDTPPTAPEGAPPASGDAPSYASAVDNTLPPYASADVPQYASAVRDDVIRDVQERRDQLMEWLKEGEDVLREYSSRLAQLAAELNLPAEDGDVLGTWNEAAPDNALPSYTMIEGREELMVGGVGEVPPTYARGAAEGR
ncbi:hypothetical protein SEUCBS139899_008266 [Sporothrix eucalyptigena]|uniref:Uncharacterized protein n=1 Tax=Sporothrix eucalyptigena TaxID=1812306 RepID=A0ABP0CE66_9PEZI